MNRKRPPKIETPRSEPEIIPPGAADPRFYHRVYVARIGPLGQILLAAAIGLLSLATIVILLGAFLLWIPVVGLIISAAIIMGVLRHYFQRRN